MMGSDFYFRDKIPVIVMGVKERMGQRLIQRLMHHPWFERVALCNDRDLSAAPPSSIVFSFLGDASEEKLWAQAGHYVIASASPMIENDALLIIAEVNGDQLILMKRQPGVGKVIANPNPWVIALALALKPLIDRFGIEAVGVTIPSCCDKEEKEIERQLFLLFPCLQQVYVEIAGQTTKLPEGEKETLSVAVKLKKQGEWEELVQAWHQFKSGSERLLLPSAPEQPLYYFSDSATIMQDKEMAVCLDHLHSLSPFDYTFSLSFSLVMRGGIGSMLLNAELLVTYGHIYW